MRIIIKSKNLELGNGLKSFIEKKFLTLKKLMRVGDEEEDFKKDSIEIFVEVERETSHHKKGNVLSIATQMDVPGKKSLFAKVKGENLASLVIKAKDLLKREIETYKFKKTSQTRQKRQKVK